VGPGRATLLAVFVVVTSWAAIGLGAHASYGARMIADEPQYVLTAISLAEDLDLEISDELAEGRWRDFHEAELPRQTEPRPDGTELSPHDPLLPALLAPAVGLFGWAGARLTMAVLAGALAAVLVWTAVARLGIPRRTAVLVVGAFALSPPLAAYGSQVYPELVAALAVAGAAAALLGPPSRWRTIGWLLPVIALPWLGVKYAPVAAALAAVGLWLDTRAANSTKWASESEGSLVENGRLPSSTRWASGSGAHLVESAVVLGIAGVAYLSFHRAVYGGWTVYAAGDHFVGGELTVVGNDPDHLGRSVRVFGLLVDRHFGLVAWAPLYLLAVPAVAALLRRRALLRAPVVLPLAAGWATATWVALTMHGWWWPGRQTVVVLPLVVLAVARLVADRPRLDPVVVTAGVVGALGWSWLVVEATIGDLTLIVDFERTANPWVRGWRWLLPDLRSSGAGRTVREVAWVLVLAALAVAGWRSGSRRSAGADQDALAGEGTDADRVPVDLDGGGPVR
jgi:hypothetical protein